MLMPQLLKLGWGYAPSLGHTDGILRDYLENQLERLRLLKKDMCETKGDGLPGTLYLHPWLRRSRFLTVTGRFGPTRLALDLIALLSAE